MTEQESNAIKLVVAVAIRVALAFGDNEIKTMKLETYACDQAEKLVNDFKRRGWEPPQ